MPGTTTTDLTQLEYEFATNPSSEAFVALAKAYLEKGRYVEAMVVCKKGIKAHPELADGRYIMACIYRAQAKHQRAIDELHNLLQMHPDHAPAYELLGEVNEKLGKEDEAIQFFKKALDFDPKLRSAREALLKKGIDYQPQPGAAVAGAPPASAPAVDSPPPAEASQSPDQRPTARQMPAVARGGQATTARGAPAAVNSVATQPAMPAQKSAATPAASPPQVDTQPALPARPPRPAPQRRRIADQFLALEAQQQKPKRRGIKFTIYMAGGLLVVLVIYVIYTWQAGLRQEKINQHLQKGQTLFGSDTYRGYLKALEHYRSIIKLDKHHPEALARAAFICAVLPGEFGADRQLQEEGNKYLQMAQAAEQSSTMLTAAGALLQVYASGNLNDARRALENALKENPSSGLLHTTLGLVLLRKGDLAEAREHLLEGARQPESATRALIGLGQYAWRRSMYREAGQAFHRAQQSNPNHVKATLYLALNALLWGDSAKHVKAAKQYLKKFDDKLAAEASEQEKAQAELVRTVLELREARNKKGAIAKLQRLLDKHRSSAIFQFVGARELRRAGNLDAAKERISLALRLDSTRPDFALEEASIYLARKDYEGTRSRAMRVQEMDAESGRSAILIGDAYLGENNFTKALQYYKEATKFEDTEALAHLKLGDAYLTGKNPDPDRAQAQFELAVRGLMTAGNGRLAAETCVKLGKIYANKNRPREFNQILKTALQADPSYAPPYCLIASNIDLSKQDGRKQAKEYCSKCLELEAGGKYTTFCKDVMPKLK